MQKANLATEQARVLGHTLQEAVRLAHITKLALITKTSRITINTVATEVTTKARGHVVHKILASTKGKANLTKWRLRAKPCRALSTKTIFHHNFMVSVLTHQ